MEKYVNCDGATIELTDRSVFVKNFGSWFSTNAKAAEIVSWCDTRIALYERWIKECKNLKVQNQKELVSNFSKEDLEAILAGFNQQ